MSAFLLRDNTELLTRARARGEFCIVHNRKVGASVGLLKGPQKFQIQFLELHVDFSIVDNTEVPTRARARVRARPLNEADGNVDFSIVDNTEIPTRAHTKLATRARKW